VTTMLRVPRLVAIIAIAALVAAALSLAACGTGPSQDSHPQADATVKCALLACTRGHLGQPCSIAGYPGIIVQVSPTRLGCDPSPGPVPTPAATTAAAAPSPVSSAATLTGHCVMGYELNTGPNQDASGIFVAGRVPGQYVSDTGGPPDPILTYQLTLTNDSESTAAVTGFAVVFYDASGAEAGSDQETATGYIVAGQSLTWTVIEDRTIHGYGDDSNQEWAQTASIPASAATCQLVGWSS